jgi:hypothetical protein
VTSHDVVKTSLFISGKGKEKVCRDTLEIKRGERENKIKGEKP